jgi:hypothetical protein
MTKTQGVIRRIKTRSERSEFAPVSFSGRWEKTKLVEASPRIIMTTPIEPILISPRVAFLAAEANSSGVIIWE